MSASFIQDLSGGLCFNNFLFAICQLHFILFVFV